MYGWAPQWNKDHPVFDIPELEWHLKGLGITSVSNVKLDKEQEREVSHEMERERQVQQPRKAKLTTDIKSTMMFVNRWSKGYSMRILMDSCSSSWQ